MLPIFCIYLARLRGLPAAASLPNPCQDLNYASAKKYLSHSQGGKCAVQRGVIRLESPDGAFALSRSFCHDHVTEIPTCVHVG